MARVVVTASADADAELIFDDLYANAGKPTVIKYRAALRALYQHLAAFPDSGAPRPKIGETSVSALSILILLFTDIPMPTTH